MTQATLSRGGFARVADLSPAEARARPLRAGDDKEMLKAAANLTRDLNTPDARIYWADLLGSALLGYAALAGAMLLRGWEAWALGAVAILALYRAGSFIHEISHIKHSQLPGFRAAWNALVGVPLLAPSFLYEGVHNQHHAKTRYGTVDDPEYLPLALMKPWTLPVFLLVSALAPIGLLIRFGLLAPLSLFSPKLRDLVVARYSGLQINPYFHRKRPEGEFARSWARLETACAVWSLVLIGLAVTGIVPLREFAILLAVTSGAMFLNQVRTMVAHLWENDGEPMSVTAQYLDSVNVPPPSTLPALWAPVGLRYHALHHLLPGVPYHNLGEAHRRLTAALAEDSAFHVTNHGALLPLMARLVRSTLNRG
jgi:fatty acid desaturase